MILIRHLLYKTTTTTIVKKLVVYVRNARMLECLIAMNLFVTGVYILTQSPPLRETFWIGATRASPADPGSGPTD